MQPNVEPTELSPGVAFLALLTPTLPPATSTNTSFIGRETFWVVDPATPKAEERRKLLSAFDAVAERRGCAAGIVLTHHHRDHVGAARWLREQRGLPIWAHARTAALLGDAFVDHVIEEGDTLRGSQAPDDAWAILHTPGHASGHIVLWEPRRRIMVIGDMVAAVGTIVVEPPDGHMATYIAQLRRLRAMDPAVLIPAHGPAIDEACEKLSFYVSHRLEREAKVLRAVVSDRQEPLAGCLMAITGRAYDDVPVAIHPLAARAALAHLVKLEEEGRVRRDGAEEVTAAALTVPLALARSVRWSIARAAG